MKSFAAVSACFSRFYSSAFTFVNRYLAALAGFPAVFVSWNSSWPGKRAPVRYAMRILPAVRSSFPAAMKPAILRKRCPHSDDGPRTRKLFLSMEIRPTERVEIIEEQIELHRGHKDIKLLLQGEGRGKGDAVRKGFQAATGDFLFILDADLTVPPSDLPKFYKAIAENEGEFINGTRLVYPMEDEAMRFLNLLGNKVFSLIFTWLLDQRIKDTLCGTKVISKKNYEALAANRSYFGDFDPFGDFDLLFGAAKLNLKIVEVPVRYRARTYGRHQNQPLPAWTASPAHVRLCDAKD